MNTLIFKICLGIFLTLLSFILIMIILSTKDLATLTKKHPRRLLAAGIFVSLIELLFLFKIVFLYPHNYTSLTITGAIILMSSAILAAGNTFIKNNKSSYYTNLVVKFLVLIGFSFMTSSIMAVTANFLIDIIAIHGQHLTAKDYILSIFYPFIFGFILQVFPSDETKETNTEIENADTNAKDIKETVTEINKKLDKLIKSGDNKK